MEPLVIACQVVIALGIVNVWILRAAEPTNWRGGSARNMAEEFAAYGLPAWFMKLIGALKLLLAALLIVGIWLPVVTKPTAICMALLMVGAIAMHFRVGDPWKRSLPALAMLVLSLFVASA